MSKKKFSPEIRSKAIEDFISGAKSAIEIAKEIGTSYKTIYRWKSAHSEEQKGIRLEEIISDGNTRNQAKKIQQLELQIDTYKSKVTEQTIIIDLLKKIQEPQNSALESELNGLIETTVKLARKRKPVKR